jgi:hypothetical protein
VGILQRVSKPEREPLVVTFVGTPGAGKTSLACTFPDPILIRTQGEAIPRDLPEGQAPDSLPELSSAEELWDIMKALINDEHSYKTLIVDSCTGLEQLFVQDVLASDTKARGINQALGGYGAGPAAVMAMHMRLRKAVELLRKRRGMHTVFLAHADIGRIDPPDSDGYTSYTLRLPGKSISPYVDSVDVVGFLKQTVILKGDEGSKKAITTGDRALVTYMTPASCAKNRLGITEDLDVMHGENPLAPWMEEDRKPKKRKPSPTVTETEIDPSDAMENA